MLIAGKLYSAFVSKFKRCCFTNAYSHPYIITITIKLGFKQGFPHTGICKTCTIKTDFSIYNSVEIKGIKDSFEIYSGKEIQQ